MPHVVNGIGTWYYGKSNRTTREADCPYCGKPATLASYDTRLWFVVFFIPVVPLGKKRITDACPICRRHGAAPLHKWKAAMQLDVSGAFAAWREKPTPENAGSAFSALMAYRQIAEAGIFADEACTKLPAEHSLHAAMAGALAKAGDHARATPIFERAHAARPDLPEARAGVAMARIRAGRLDEARPLLAHLEEPGSGHLHGLAPLEELGYAFQAAGRHGDALDVFAKLLRELPAAADHQVFRKKVRACEKALGRKESILPKRPFSVRRLFARSGPGDGSGKRALAIAAIILALVAAGLLIANEYIRRHRTVHIINALDKPASVVIAGAGTFNAPPGRTEVTLAEGNYHVGISGPVTQEFDCAVSTGSSWRVGDDAAWVINVGGRAILLRTVLVYRKNNPPPGEVQPVFGEAFTYFPKVTHPFNELPKTVSVKGSESRTLAKLEVFHGDPRDVIAHFAANNRPDEALRACEWLLGINPGDEFALEQYSGIAAAKFPGRAERFLAAGLDRRPVNVQWHRVYQSMALVGGKREDLAKLYDGMLAKEPGSSALIYLRGRIIEDPVQSRAHYERALAADGTNPWPSYALGSIAADEGDWKTARPHAERAALAAPQNLEFRSRVRDAMLGERDFAALESDFRNGLKANPNDFASFAGLVETLVAAGNVEGAKTAADEFIKRVARITGGGAEVARSARVFTALATGDHAAAERLAGPAGGFLLQALVAQDKIEPAERLARDPYARLLVALAWHLRGDTARFAQWRETAATAFAGDPGTREVAALLRDPGPVAPARLARIPWPARQKAVLAAVLAASHPPGDGMRALARRLNIGVVMPAPLVARFLDAAR